MEFFKKRNTAIAVFVVVVVVFSLIGCHLSLSRAVRQVEDAFFDKTLLHADGYYTCPADQLQNCVALSNRLLSVIGQDSQWSEAYEELKTCRLALDDALRDRDIQRIANSNQALVEAVAAVEALVEAGAPLPDSNDDFYAIISDFHGAQSVLDNNAYNNHVLAFWDGVLNPFPTNILRHLTFVAPPETFP